MVIPAATLDQRDRPGSGRRRREGIPACAKHHIDDLHPMIGDPRIEGDQRRHHLGAEVHLGRTCEMQARHHTIARERNTADGDLVAGRDAGCRSRGPQCAGISRAAAIVVKVESVGLRTLVVNDCDHRQGAGYLARQHHRGGIGNCHRRPTLDQHCTLHR